ncbi:MAG: 5-oxoprolinase subunit PxpA [Acidimicrobiales bacterium]
MGPADGERSGGAAPADAAPAVDLNADLGELDSPDGGASDEALLRVVTTAHIACGGHAGTGESMRRTVAVALAAGATVGAHPSYLDREGFGRRPLARSPGQVADDVAWQVERLQRVAAREGAVVRSVKAHGALYNRMAGDADCAAAVARAVRACDPELVLVVLAGSRAEAVVAAEGLRPGAEGFCDRGYLADGSLAPRSSPGALVTDPEAAAARAVSLAVHRRVPAVDGKTVSVKARTLCVHGDSPGAVALAGAVRRSLEAHGVAVVPLVGGARPTVR